MHPRVVGTGIYKRLAYNGRLAQWKAGDGACNPFRRENAHEEAGERERERKRALLGTMLHNGGSRAAPAEITDMHGRSLSACSSIK